MKQILPSRRGAVAAFLLTLGLTAGCGSATFRQPTIDLQNISVGGIGLSGGTLLVDVRVYNPNGYSLGADQIQYNLAVRGAKEPTDTSFTEVASGTYDQSFTVRGGGTRTLRIPVQFSYAGIGGARSALLRNGSIIYRARGTVLARTPIGPREVPFAKTGTVLMTGGEVR